MRLAWCTCGWTLFLRGSAEFDLRKAVPVMVDHWEHFGHTVRADLTVKRSLASAAARYAADMARGVSRAAYETDAYRDAARAATRAAGFTYGPDDFDPFRT